MPADPTAHHKDCYREHHACAVARLDALLEMTEGVRDDPRQPEGTKITISKPREVKVARLVLVAVRDITEGRS